MFYSAENSKRSMNISARPYDPAKGLTLEEHIRMESNRAVALSRKGMRSSLSSQSSIGLYSSMFVMVVSGVKCLMFVALCVMI